MPLITTDDQLSQCGSGFIHVFDNIGKGMNYNSDVIMCAIASQITSLTIVHSTVYSGEDQRKHQSSASLASVWGIHRWPMNSPHKRPLTRKLFPYDDVIMILCPFIYGCLLICCELKQSVLWNLITTILFILSELYRTNQCSKGSKYYFPLHRVDSFVQYIC